MAISVWVDPLIKINKHKEDSLKMELGKILKKVFAIEDKIKRLEKAKDEHQKQVNTLLQQPAGLNIICQTIDYIDSIKNNIKILLKELNQLKNEENNCRKLLQSIAKKRKLLAGIHDEHVKQEVAKIEKKEEDFLAEIAQYKFREVLNSEK